VQVNPIPAGFDPLAPMEQPPAMPTYKPYKDPVEKSVAFEQLDALFEQRIGMIDGAMGTNIQDYKLDENDYRGERYKVCILLLA
jgi:5-methyltetrahydrofolate--homocysteine methyltransferase